MIGGIDIDLPGSTTGHELDFILSKFREKWPEAQVQNADVSVVESIHDVVFPSMTREAEFFIYRDLEAYQLWNMFGATIENESAMVNVIITNESITMVTGSVMSDFVKELQGLIAKIRKGNL